VTLPDIPLTILLYFPPGDIILCLYPLFTFILFLLLPIPGYGHLWVMVGVVSVTCHLIEVSLDFHLWIPSIRYVLFVYVVDYSYILWIPSISLLLGSR